jgi:hypothetical protein
MDFSRRLADCNVFLWKTLRVMKESVPQGLKPRYIGGFYGTAEAVPLSKTKCLQDEMLAGGTEVPPLQGNCNDNCNCKNNGCSARSYG